MIEQGQKVIYTRTTDKYLTLAQRADIANKSGCDTFTSIHCNSAKDATAHGIETFSHPLSTNGIKLSKLVQEELVKATGLTNRGCKQANFGVLRMSNMVAVLIETAFISNSAEENLLLQNDFKEKIALAIVKVIFKYLNLEFKEKEIPKAITPHTEKPVEVALVKKPYQERYVREFQKFYNEVTATTTTLKVDGVYGENTEKAYQILARLIRGEY